MTRSSVLAWKIPWTEEHGGLQSMGQTQLSTHTQTHLHYNDVKPFCGIQDLLYKTSFLLSTQSQPYIPIS